MKPERGKRTATYIVEVKINLHRDFTGVLPDAGNVANRVRAALAKHEAYGVFTYRTVDVKGVGRTER